MTLLANAVTWICALATIITEGMSVKGHLNSNNRWFVSLLFTGYHHTHQFSVNDGNLRRERYIVCSPHKHRPSIFCGTLVWMESKSLFYLAIIPFAALMILLTTFISQSNLRDVQIFFYGGVIVITGTTLLIYIILHLKKQWYGTEA